MLVFTCSIFATPVLADKQSQADVSIGAAERHHEDPTKVITKLALGYNEDLTLSGAISLDEVRKLNANINEDGSNWKVGGSWLFKHGIVNFNIRHSEFDHGAKKDGYSIGTFIPLTSFDVKPFDIEIFPMAGLSKNEGDMAVKNQDTPLEQSYVLLPTSSIGGYIGYFAFRPMTEKWTALSFGGLSKGSDDYNGHWYGVGASYKIDAHQSFNTYMFASDDDFGSDEKIGFTYSYEFDGFSLNL